MQVREYALLTTRPDAVATIDVGVISQATFDWILTFTESWSRDITVLYDRGHRALKLGSLVGYLRSPEGEEIEILPKTGLGRDNPLEGRLVLRTMLASALSLKSYESGDAQLMTSELPIHEWIYGQFLNALQRLLSRGLRFDYLEIKEEVTYLRGRIDMSAQQRQRPGSAHRFQVQHEIYSPDRLENRLLKSALVSVHRSCRTSENWRVSNVLMHQLDELPKEPNVHGGMDKWSDARLMQGYGEVKPWCSLILRQMNPDFQKGKHSGIALLFPMERLFEKHVACTLSAQVLPDWRLKQQVKSKYLIQSHAVESHAQAQRMFALSPDLLLEGKNESHVLDTKWKLLDQNNVRERYGLLQSDFYQMFAYAHGYQNGSGDMMLIYPRHSSFEKPLPPFEYNAGLVIWVVPFCLQSDTLVSGLWEPRFPAFAEASPVGLNSGRLQYSVCRGSA